MGVTRGRAYTDRPEWRSRRRGGATLSARFPESVSSMGRLVTGPQHYRRRFLSPVVALSRQSARCKVWPLSVVKRSRIARCEAFSVWHYPEVPIAFKRVRCWSRAECLSSLGAPPGLTQLGSRRLWPRASKSKLPYQRRLRLLFHQCRNRNVRPVDIEEVQVDGLRVLQLQKRAAIRLLNSFDPKNRV